MNKLSFYFIAELASILVLSHPTYAATLGQNLIVNGGAEQGVGDPIGDAVGNNLSPIPGWERSGNFNVIKYGASGFEFINSLGQVVRVNLPDANVPGPSNRGNNLFFGGADRVSSSASQSIFITSLASVIDAGKATFNLSGWLGGYDDDNDIAELNITFLNQTKQSLGTASISAPNSEQRQNITGLFFKSNEGFIPIGTRQFDVVLNANYNGGRVNDAYADNLSLVINQVPEPKSSSLSLLATSGFLVWKLRKKGIQLR